MSICALCQTEFLCGVVDQVKDQAETTCWCMALPKVSISKPSAVRNYTSASCLCPDCLSSLRRQSMPA